MRPFDSSSRLSISRAIAGIVAVGGLGLQREAFGEDARADAGGIEVLHDAPARARPSASGAPVLSAMSVSGTVR